MVFHLTILDVSIDSMAKFFFLSLWCIFVPTQLECVSPLHVSCLRWVWRKMFVHTGYFRYVDDIPIMYKDDWTNTHDVFDDVNSLIPSIKFTLEREENNKISFLDITIAEYYDGQSFETNRKPTTTDVIIPNVSCHTRKHKTAAIRYFAIERRRINGPPKANRKKNTVQQTLFNNSYNVSTLSKFSKEKKQKKTLRKKNGQKLPMSEKKRDLLRSCLKTLMSRSRSLLTTQLKDAYHPKMWLTKISKTRVVYTS
jgi:hypothetical protein